MRDQRHAEVLDVQHLARERDDDAPTDETPVAEHLAAAPTQQPAAEVIDIAKAIENSTPIDVIRRTDLPPAANGLATPSKGDAALAALNAKQRTEAAHA